MGIKSKQINNFLSDEFSKFVGENEDYKYLISSTFAQKCAQNGFDGVLYPSVRTMGLGLNVAIKPSSVDEKMELISVLDCKVFKRQKKVIMNNLAFCDVSEGNENFELIMSQKIPSQLKFIVAPNLVNGDFALEVNS
jgi:hypothetical protein